jgi:hypothetical protein
MKKLILGASILPLLTFATGAIAQVFMPPRVTVEASGAVATRPGSPGEFTVFRHGATNQALNIFCHVYGTAVNGVDYEQLRNWVSIPAGERSAAIRVAPVDNGQTADLQTVVLQLDYPPMMPPSNYVIGDPRKAVVYIRGTDAGNLGPVVRIISPIVGAAFRAGANVFIAADAHNLNATGYVATVEFFANGTSLGIATNNPYAASPLNPFVLTWSNAPPGEYKLTAKAVDNSQLSAVSEPLGIIVFSSQELPTVVEMIASQGSASEPCEGAEAAQGSLLVTRYGNTNIDLPVFLNIRGSASNGVDYASISNVVVIPKGAISAEIFVLPLADPITESAEAVAIQVAQPPCIPVDPPPPECYTVGRQMHGVVWIRDCPGSGSDLPPVVRITGPANGSMFRAPVDIPLFAYARDADDGVRTVEFFAGTTSLGIGKPLANATRPMHQPTNVFMLVWSNAPVGTWEVTAKATDDREASSVSAPVKITVLPVPPPPPDRPSIVSLIATDPIALEGTNCWPWLGVTNRVPSWGDWTTSTYKVFTNCGPKNALFTIRRFGPTNAALTVAYQISGTAKNGIDYVELPGTLTIGAGERRTLLPIVPLDSGEPHTNKTIVLKLSSSPDYQLGFPARAAAVIIDSQSPHWWTGMLPGGAFRLNARGPDAAWFHIEYSTNMVHWRPISTNQVVNGSIDFIDPDAMADTVRFYRAVAESAPPAD